MKTNNFFLASIIFTLGFVAGACEKDGDDDPFWNQCDSLERRRVGCAEVAFEGCEDPPCYEVCTKRGKAAAKFSAACGDLWVDFYECLRDMTCEEYDQWDASQADDTLEYPCGTLEAEFHTTCPDLSLFPGDK